MIRINRFAGGSEFSLHAVAMLSSTNVKKAWSRPPISMGFSLSMFTSSGIVVRYLKIFEKADYSTVKWVRYLVRAGSYEIRVSKFDSLRIILTFPVLKVALNIE